ncbi:MAG: ATP-binding protein [Acidobacteriota bacterium]
MQVVKLLLVDDDPDNLFALQAILEPLGQQLMLATTGLEALKLCLDQDFAAILLDVRMPGMDGFETAQMIRNRKRSSQTPILFLTAYRSDEQLFRGYNLGAVDFLFKPIVPEVLQSKVAVFVELSRKEQLLRLQAEHVSKAERKFRAVLEAAPDAMVITDASGIVELTNSRADALFGYARESLVGMDILKLIPAWERPEPISGNWHHPPSVELRLSAVRRDGATIPADVTASACHTPDGLFLTTAVRDATDRVLAETRIQKLNLELEARVQERTRALSRSNEALRQFAWAASHDLQEPVRTVVAYSEWLDNSTQGLLGEREAQMLSTIRQHGERLHSLLGALREYIRVSESRDQAATRVSCHGAACTAAAALQSLIEESNATIEYGELPELDSVEILLVQLFQNLISNAIKYRADRAPRIRIWAQPETQGWTISVEDNGKGIDPKHFAYIFGVFRRLQGGQTSGTGVGLAICKAAVERLGGRIWVESSPGAGSAFRFFLPQGVNVNETATSILG